MTPEVMEVFEMYVQNRKDMKKPLTPLAKKMRLEELEKLSGGNPRMAIAILKQSINGPWLGLFALTTPNLAMFRAEEMERVGGKRHPCEWCGKEILESNRYQHEDNECPNFKRANPQDIAKTLETLSKSWGVN